MSDAESLIAKYNEIKDHLGTQSKAFSEYCKPFNDELDSISNQLLDMLNQLNAGKPEGKRASLSTDAGTAYLSTIVTPKVTDKEKFLDWTLENWDKYGALLQIGAPQKAALEEYMDANDNKLPPFVDVSTFTRVNIRRT